MTSREKNIGMRMEKIRLIFILRKKLLAGKSNTESKMAKNKGMRIP
jgi:hypothetical protein